MIIPSELQGPVYAIVGAIILFLAARLRSATKHINQESERQKIAIKALEDDATSNKSNYEFVLKAATDATAQVKSLTTQLTINYGEITALKAENEIVKTQRERDRRDRNETAEQLNQLKGQFEQSAKENIRLFEDNRRLSEQKIEVAVANAKLLNQNELLATEKAIILKEKETVLKQNEGYRADMRGAMDEIKSLKDDLAKRPTREEFEKATDRLKILEAQHEEYNRLSADVLKAHVENKQLHITLDHLQAVNEITNKRNEELTELLVANGIAIPSSPVIDTVLVTLSPAPIASKTE